MDIWLILFSFTFLQGVLLSISFFLQKENKLQSRIFGFLLFAIALIIAESIVKHTGLYTQFPHILGVSFILNYLIGPLYFFYFKSAEKNFNWKWIHLTALIPLLVPLFRRWVFYLGDAERKIRAFEIAFIEGRFAITRLPVVFEVLVNTGFIVLAILVIHKNELTKKTSYKWAKVLSYCFIGFWIIYLIATFIMSYKDIYSITFGYIQNLGLATIVIIISYYLMHKSDAFKFSFNTRGKYLKSQLSPEERATYGKKVMDYLESKNPYFDNEFNQTALSKAVDISNNKLSQVFNEELGTNFYDLINKMRVAEMKKRMMNPNYSNITIMGIAFEVGFNSKSGMIRNFKKETGMTPSEYLKKSKV